MRTFTPMQFATFLGTLAVMDAVEKKALEKAGAIVRDECVRVLGTYEYGWPPLAPSTLARKAADTPGLETGEMRDSIEYTADDHAVQIGSDNDKLVWFELGTSRQPPRSVLVEALHRKTNEVLLAVGHEFAGHLIRP
jgi:hypothetical protein